MAQPIVDNTSSSPADKAKLGAAAVAFVAAFAAYYLLGSQATWLRVLALLALLAVAVALFLIADLGKSLIAYTRESVREVRKVVWPERKEAIQMTAVVFGFVVLMALFLWLTDKSLEWLLYDLLLGWKH